MKGKKIALFLALGLLAFSPLAFANHGARPIPSAIPCVSAEIVGVECPIISSRSPGVATDSVKAAEYWAENKRPTFGKMPRAFVQTEGCKWFNTIKKECEGK